MLAIVPPQPHGLLTAALHLSQKRTENFTLQPQVLPKVRHWKEDFTFFSNHIDSRIACSQLACTCHTPNHMLCMQLTSPVVVVVTVTTVPTTAAWPAHSWLTPVTQQTTFGAGN